MSGSENSDRDFASVGHKDLLELHDRGVSSKSLMDRVFEVVRLTIFMISLGAVGSHGWGFRYSLAAGECSFSKKQSSFKQTKLSKNARESFRGRKRQGNESVI